MKQIIILALFLGQLIAGSTFGNHIGFPSEEDLSERNYSDKFDNVNEKKYSSDEQAALNVIYQNGLLDTSISAVILAMFFWGNDGRLCEFGQWNLLSVGMSATTSVLSKIAMENEKNRAALTKAAAIAGTLHGVLNVFRGYFGMHLNFCGGIPVFGLPGHKGWSIPKKTPGMTALEWWDLIDNLEPITYPLSSWRTHLVEPFFYEDRQDLVKALIFEPLAILTIGVGTRSIYNGINILMSKKKHTETFDKSMNHDDSHKFTKANASEG
ncbi:MAG: hypothetical protein AB8G05_06225 [Oligoflexales bacterium]